jgi:pyruvate/2-oxoacid:ferredoxin oxidoreductase alpha subunit
MVCFDGFFISHTHEAVDIPEQDEVDGFLPPRHAELKLDPENPLTFSGGTLPDNFMEFRYKLQKTFERANDIVSETFEEFGSRFGRSYGSVEPYFVDGAEAVIMASGSAASTVYHTARQMRDNGKKVGMIRLRQFRPFPEEDLLSLMKPDVRYGVIDRDLSPGTGGVFAQEIRGMLNKHGMKHRIREFIAGLGGRDITVGNVEEVFSQTANGGANDSKISWIGLKGK